MCDHQMRDNIVLVMGTTNSLYLGFQRWIIPKGEVCKKKRCIVKNFISLMGKHNKCQFTNVLSFIKNVLSNRKKN